MLSILKPGYICAMVAGAMYIFMGIIFGIGAIKSEAENGKWWLKMGVVLGCIGFITQMVGEWITIGVLSSYGEKIGLLLGLSIGIFVIAIGLGFYIWGAANRFQGTGVVSSYNEIPKTGS